MNTTTRETARGPGRPEVGNPVHVRLGELQPAVDEFAGDAITRAEAVRRLIKIGLEQATNRSVERHAVLDEAYEIANDLSEGAPLRSGVFSDELEERLYVALPAAAILRNCAAAAYEADIDLHHSAAASTDSEFDLLIEPSEQTRLFDTAHEAALRAFIFGHRV